MPETSSPRTKTGSRPVARQVLVALLLGALAFAITVQVRQDESDTFSGVRGVELVELLKSLDAANTRLNDQIAELSQTRENLQSSNLQSETAAEEARRRSEQLAILAGTIGATGPGIRVTIDDPDSSVDAGVLLDAVQELRDAGAEVIVINGTARVVAQTWFADDASRVRVGGREVERPFVIEAIGDSETMEATVGFRGGIADRVASRGGTTKVERVESITITALADVTTPEYARPES